MTTTNEKLFEYIKASPTPYHAVKHTAETLLAAGYTELCEGDEWSLATGCRYFVTRGGSSLISFKIPEGDAVGFMISAAHSDSPCFKIKDNSIIDGGSYLRLSTEGYGGMICSTWLDRPLAVAGRVTVKTERGLDVKLVDSKKPCAIIPNVAIHMNRKVNEGVPYNNAVDMIPLFGSTGNSESFSDMIASLAGVPKEDIITHDLLVYNPECGVEWNEFISSPRLDDLQCAFASFEAYVNAETGRSIPVYCLFDNEEVGSLTKQGADSTFLNDTLERVCSALNGRAFKQMCADSFLVSCDNAHAVHPNHPELSDKNHSVYMNGGIVIKYNANQKYTSDAISAGLFRLICDEAGVKCQMYANRADMPGGSTLGNISNAHVSLNSIDIGLAQLAMHSSFETAGRNDTADMIRALTLFFSRSIKMKRDGEYVID